MDIRKELREIFLDHTGLDDIKADIPLSQSGLDSLDVVEIVLEAEDTFGIEITDDDVLNTDMTFEDLERLVERKLK
jgi:acyl carrier protein